MRPFHLQRDTDVTGVSGTGIVADGVLFDDDTAVVYWRGEDRSVVTWRSLAALKRVHGHDGKTRVVFLDGGKDDSHPGVVGG